MGEDYKLTMWKSVGKVVIWCTIAAYMDEVRTHTKPPVTFAGVQGVIRTQDFAITKRRAINWTVTFGVATSLFAAWRSVF